ncbi:MAG: DUF480 domain-containing protein [Acidiferrobacterales bacterium]|nr:DUF480 domain-containing protein [Acidiferrobacterales bacterium]
MSHTENTDQQPSSDSSRILETSDSRKVNEAMFNPIEARVLACLMEKELTTPDNYPLTLNSLVLACNQKSNREPVMQLTEGDVGHAARALADRHFIKIEYRGRTQKLTHKMQLELSIDRKQQSLLTVMMLRSPLTLNDLRTRTSRMVEFEDLEDIELTLEMMNDRRKPMVLMIPKGPGQREDRYTHLLCGDVDIQFDTVPSSTTKSSRPQLEQRVEELEQRVKALEEMLSAEND